jgi:hypothetical protein
MPFVQTTPPVSKDRRADKRYRCAPAALVLVRLTESTKTAQGWACNLGASGIKAGKPIPTPPGLRRDGQRPGGSGGHCRLERQSRLDRQRGEAPRRAWRWARRLRRGRRQGRLWRREWAQIPARKSGLRALTQDGPVAIPAEEVPHPGQSRWLSFLAVLTDSAGRAVGGSLGPTPMPARGSEGAGRANALAIAEPPGRSMWQSVSGFSGVFKEVLLRNHLCL